MPGKKVDVIEVERLDFTEDGRGLIVYSDGTNFVYKSTTPWTCGAYISGSMPNVKACLPTASSLGWWKVHYVSGSTYGATGAAAYIPVFRNLNINTV